MGKGMRMIQEELGEWRNMIKIYFIKNCYLKKLVFPLSSLEQKRKDYLSKRKTNKEGEGEDNEERGKDRTIEKKLPKRLCEYVYAREVY